MHFPGSKAQLIVLNVLLKNLDTLFDESLNSDAPLEELQKIYGRIIFLKSERRLLLKKNKVNKVSAMDAACYLTLIKDARTRVMN